LNGICGIIKSKKKIKQAPTSIFFTALPKGLENSLIYLNHRHKLSSDKTPVSEVPFQASNGNQGLI
jgi:hypothetical protein